MLSESGIRLIKERIAITSLNGTLHQFSYSIAHKTTHIVYRMFRQSDRAQSKVYTRRQIINGIQQSAVQIKNISVVFFHTYCILNAKLSILSKKTNLAMEKTINFRNFANCI